MKRTILHVLDINASIDKITNALTTIEGLQGWWTGDTSGSAIQGGTINFNFASVFNPIMQVVPCEPNKIQWECVGGEKDWKGDKFFFVIEPANGRTKLTFTQEYFNEITDEQYGRFNFNWGYYLNSLKQLCETGKGMPFNTAK